MPRKLKIISYKVTLKTVYSGWLPENIEILEADREVYEQLIKDTYKRYGLEVVDVRLMFSDGTKVVHHKEVGEINDTNIAEDSL